MVLVHGWGSAGYTRFLSVPSPLCSSVVPNSVGFRHTAASNKQPTPAPKTKYSSYTQWVLPKMM